jgi:mono/diheme cytochrome c family protein
MRGSAPAVRNSVDRNGTVPSPGRAVGFAAIVTVTLFFAQGCSDVSGDPGPFAEGHALYQANCLTCHGDDARGDGPMARSLPVEPPSILEHLGHHTQAQLVQMIRGGIPPAMPPTALSDDEVRQIIDYVWTLVPDSEVAELRAMQQQMEATGGAPVGSPPGMPAMDHSQHMQGAAPEMDHSQHMQPATPAMDQSQHVPAPAPEVDHSQHMQGPAPEVDHSQHGPEHSQHSPGSTSMGRMVNPIWMPDGSGGAAGGRWS